MDKIMEWQKLYTPSDKIYMLKTPLFTVSVQKRSDGHWYVSAPPIFYETKIEYQGDSDMIAKRVATGMVMVSLESIMDDLSNLTNA